MKVYIFCLIGSLFYLALADVDNAKNKKGDANATDKSSDTKQKRDASLVSSVYHGPSYKYLPPVSSAYDSYSGGVGGYSGGHISGFAGGYRSGSTGHGHRHQGFSSSGNYNIATSHGLGHYGTASSYSGGHHGKPFSNHYADQGSTKYFGSGLKGSAGAHSSATQGHGSFHASRPHSYAIGHGYDSSGSSVSNLEHNIHYPLVANAPSGSGYHFSKGADGSLSSLGASGFGLTQGLSSAVGSSLDEEHHAGHVHNGGAEHVYVISNVPADNTNSHNSGGQQGNHVLSTVSYLPPVKQHPLPSTSYGEPISNAGDAYNTKYYSQTSAGVEHGPAYAAGHKGLGYFSYTANKPNVLHTSITGSTLKQPSYSKAPFKPSIFLGAKFEGNAPDNDPSQQYLPPLGVGSDSTGYDYPIPTGSSINYQEPSYQQSVEIQSVSLQEPDSSYLPPKNNQDSLNETPSAPSSNYLPPSNSYGVPYSN